MSYEIYELVVVGGFTMVGFLLMMRRERRRKRAMESASMRRMLGVVCK